MCQVHTGANVSLLTPGEIDHTACHPRKTTRTTYITPSIVSLRIRSTDESQSEKRNKEKKTRYRKGKERKEKKAKLKILSIIVQIQPTLISVI